ncbi:MAG: N-6 DNA methylase [Rickettsiaceae bacterium]|nr:N-6 DNA methylase [Rickettsiaceae bacterium]
MSEELLQRNLIKSPEKIGAWDFYNIGATTINALKHAEIIRSIDYGNIGCKKIDAIITKQKEVIAIVEYKQPKNFNTIKKKNNAILQEMEVARKLGSKLVIATDTQETIWINVATGNQVKDESGNDFKYSFDYKDINLQKVITEIIQSINDRNDTILPKRLVNPTDLAKQIWQDVWSVSGATPENCLYTFVELFIFKYLSDLNILQGTYSFDNLLRMYNKDEVNTVLQHYASIIRPRIKVLFPPNPTDGTTIINGTIFVSKDQKPLDGYGIVFKKVLEKFRDYGKLEYIEHDFKSQLFESFLKESISKKNWGQFFTPIKVVRAISKMAEMNLKDMEGITICDPACGVGKFPLEFIKNNIDKFFKIENGNIVSQIKIVGFDKGFDKEEQKTIILAKANMLIYFSELIKDNVGLTKEFAKLFNESFILKTDSILGTLVEAEQEKYDLILTNPPYVTSGSSNLREEITKNTTLKNYYKTSGVGIEGLFMVWIINALKKGGKAFIVVPDGIFSRQNDKNLRQYILDNCYIDAIISLPAKSFFTTLKKTYILAITKKHNISEVQKDSVFTYLCSEIGESRDIYRFDIEQDDLNEATELFRSFVGNKKTFAKLNNDLRCKVQIIGKFKAENSWVIENYWSYSEKVELNIEEENKSLFYNDFVTLINGSSKKIKKEVNSVPLLKDFDVVYKKQKIEDLFDLPAIKGLTATFIQKNQGNIPVYGGKRYENPVGHVKDNLYNVKYFSNCLAWNREGTVGYVFYHRHKFTTNDHHRPMVIKKEYINQLDYEYMRYAVEDVLLSQGFRWSKTASKEKVAKLFVKIPITKAGQFDLIKQKEIADRYRVVAEIKKNIKAELEMIENITVNVG